MKNLTLIISVHATSDYADPQCQYAYLEITPAFLDKLREHASICTRHNLLQLATSAGPIHWDDEEEINIQSESLEITASASYGSFWFEGFQKHGDYHYETSAIEITALEDVAGRLFAGREFAETAGWHFEDGILAYSDYDAAELIEIFQDEVLQCAETTGSEA